MLARDNRKRMRWYGCAIVAIAAQLAWAMPTKDEIKRAIHYYSLARDFDKVADGIFSDCSRM